MLFTLHRVNDRCPGTLEGINVSKFILRPLVTRKLVILFKCLGYTAVISITAFLWYQFFDTVTIESAEKGKRLGESG